MQDSDEPSFTLGDLRIWVLGRAFPDGTEWWDRDVLQIRAECRAPGSTVTVTGALLRSDEIGALMNGMEAMHRWESKAFDWRAREPNLAISLKSPHGGLAIQVDITPDHMTQRHEFHCHLDLTYLLEPIAQCRQILRVFPVTPAPRSYRVRISD